MSARREPIGAGVLAAALLATASPVRAQSAPVRAAQAAFRRGLDAQAHHRCAEAAEYFLRSFELAPRGNTLYNLALARDCAGHHVLAVDALTTYLSIHESAETPSHLAELRDAFDRWRRALVTVTILPADARIVLDGAEVAPTPGGTLRLDPGPHAIEARAQRRASQSIARTFSAGETFSITLGMDGATPAPVVPFPTATVAPGAPITSGRELAREVLAPRVPAEQPRSRWVVPVVVSVGVALVAAGMVTAVVLLNEDAPHPPGGTLGTIPTHP